MKRTVLTFTLMAFLMCAIGCSEIVVLERDEGTIQNFREQRQFYVEDISDAGQFDHELTDADFPIGDLTWQQYSATLQTYDSAIAREEAKKTREEIEDGE